MIQFERLAELRMRREWRDRNDRAIALLEQLLDLKPNGVPDAERLKQWGD